MEIGQRIRELREKRELNQEEFAQSIGVTQRMISYYETGKGGVPDKVIKAIIDRYALPKDYFSAVAALTPGERLVDRLIELTMAKKIEWVELGEFTVDYFDESVEHLYASFLKSISSMDKENMRAIYFCFPEKEKGSALRGYAIIQADTVLDGKRSPDRVFLAVFQKSHPHMGDLPEFHIIDSFSSEYTGLSDLYAMVRDTFADTSGFIQSLIDGLEDL